MQTKKLLVALVTASTFALPAVPAFADDDDLTMEQLPAAVQERVRQEARGGSVHEIEKDSVNGKVAYEVHFSKGDKEYELTIAKDGKVLQREEETVTKID